MRDSEACAAPFLDCPLDDVITCRAAVKVPDDEVRWRMSRAGAGGWHRMEVEYYCDTKARKTGVDRGGNRLVIGSMHCRNPLFDVSSGKWLLPNVSGNESSWHQSQPAPDLGRHVRHKVVAVFPGDQFRINLVFAPVKINPGPCDPRFDSLMLRHCRIARQQIRIAILERHQCVQTEPPQSLKFVRVAATRVRNRDNQRRLRNTGSGLSDRFIHPGRRSGSRNLRQCWKFLGFCAYHTDTPRYSVADMGRFMPRILLAEDEEAMRLYLERALVRSGYAVSSVDRGTSAYALLEAGESFDLLLTDIVMPEMDGIELAQKAAIIAPDMRVMFITGFSAVTLRAGQTMPNAKVLSKPFHLKDLVLEVDRVFQSATASGLN